MKRINIVLYAILFLEVFTIEDQAAYNQDLLKCDQPNYNPYQITAQKCAEITPYLSGTGMDKGQCCKITANWDPLLSFKTAYRENWKAMACQLYGIDPSISDDQLRQVVFANQPNEKCQIIRDNNKKIDLYSSALLTMDKKIVYNCGYGDETFYADYFVPYNDLEALAKDFADCNNMNENYIEKNCYKQGNKLLSDKTQCCWCETTYFTQILSGQNSKVCMGSNINMFAESLNNMKNAYIATGLQMKYSCRCTNKYGQVINGGFDTTTGQVFVN